MSETVPGDMDSVVITGGAGVNRSTCDGARTGGGMGMSV